MHLLRDQKAYQKCEVGGEKLLVYDAREDYRNIKQKECKHVSLVVAHKEPPCSAGLRMLSPLRARAATQGTAAGSGWPLPCRNPGTHPPTHRSPPGPAGLCGIRQCWSRPWPPFGGQPPSLEPLSPAIWLQPDAGASAESSPRRPVRPSRKPRNISHGDLFAFAL